jgi:O-antigen/teichoic acid export membrane protein
VPMSKTRRSAYHLGDRTARLKSAIKHIGAGGGGELADLGLRSLGSLFLARVLGPAGLGVWLVAKTVAYDLGGITARFGLDEAVMRFVSYRHGKGELKEAKGALLAGLKGSVLISVPAVAVVFFLAPLLADEVFNKPESHRLISIVAFSLLIFSPTCVLLSAVQGAGLLRLRVVAQKIALPAAQVLVLAMALIAGWGMNGVLGAHFVGLLAMAAVAWTVGWGGLTRIIGRGTKRFPLRPLFSFATPLAFAEVSNFVVLWTDILMLGIMSTSEQAGIYGVAMRLASLVWLPLHAGNQMFSPMIAGLHARGEIEGLKEMFQLTARWILLASLPVFVIISSAREFLLSLFGPGFVLGGTVVLLLAGGKLIASATGSVGFMLNMTGHQRLNLANSLAMALMNAILNYVWIGKWGAAGAAAASALSLSVINILRVVQVKRILGLSLFSRGYRHVVLAAVVAAAVAGLVHHFVGTSFPRVVLGILFLGVYVSVVFGLGLEEADREAIRLIARKVR